MTNPAITRGAILALAAKGATQADACRHFGCDERAIRRRLRPCDSMPRGRSLFTPPVVERLVSLANGERRTPEIAALLSLAFGGAFTQHGVRRRMERMGLPRAPRGGGPGMAAGSYRRPGLRQHMDPRGLDAGLGFDWLDVDAVAVAAVVPANVDYGAHSARGAA